MNFLNNTIALYDPPVSEASYAAQRTELRLILFSVSSLQKNRSRQELDYENQSFILHSMQAVSRLRYFII